MHAHAHEHADDFVQAQVRRRRDSPPQKIVSSLPLPLRPRLFCGKPTRTALGVGVLLFAVAYVLYALTTAGAALGVARAEPRTPAGSFDARALALAQFDPEPEWTHQGRIRLEHRGPFQPLELLQQHQQEEPRQTLALLPFCSLYNPTVRVLNSSADAADDRATTFSSRNFTARGRAQSKATATAPCFGCVQSCLFPTALPKQRMRRTAATALAVLSAVAVSASASESASESALSWRDAPSAGAPPRPLLDAVVHLHNVSVASVPARGLVSAETFASETHETDDVLFAKRADEQVQAPTLSFEAARATATATATATASTLAESLDVEPSASAAASAAASSAASLISYLLSLSPFVACFAALTFLLSACIAACRKYIGTASLGLGSRIARCVRGRTPPVRVDDENRPCAAAQPQREREREHAHEHPPSLLEAQVDAGTVERESTRWAAHEHDSVSVARADVLDIQNRLKTLEMLEHERAHQHASALQRKQDRDAERARTDAAISEIL